MLSLAPITIFTDGAHTIDYLPNCVFWTNTIGKIKRSFDLMGPNGPPPRMGSCIHYKRKILSPFYRF